MKLYLTRHGQTRTNKKNRVHQDPNTRLSKEGRKEASLLSEFFIGKSIDLILSSSYPRAIETAKIIQSKLNIPLLESQLLIERRNPSEIIGKKHSSNESRKARKRIYRNYSDPDFRYSDEETFFEVKSRGLKFLSSVTQFEKKEIIVVTHEHFYLMLLSLMINENVKPMEYLNFDKTFEISNTGVSVCEYRKKWTIKSVNNTSHLHFLQHGHLDDLGKLI